ncbi:hypothetical protein [Sorangium cellulosum]|uniref:hypothetical protein n=1 Tax=Sorangium cellulosum TaxID=56 RepID=UPI000CF501F4|nr:hypothetical protein [Sorangium cellulosum]
MRPGLHLWASPWTPPHLDGFIGTYLGRCSPSGGSRRRLGVAGKELQFSVPAHGWATVNWK